MTDPDWKSGVAELVSTVSYMLGYTHDRWKPEERERIWAIIKKWDQQLNPEEDQ